MAGEASWSNSGSALCQGFVKHPFSGFRNNLYSIHTDYSWLLYYFPQFSVSPRKWKPFSCLCCGNLWDRAILETWFHSKPIYQAAQVCLSQQYSSQWMLRWTNWMPTLMELIIPQERGTHKKINPHNTAPAGHAVLVRCPAIRMCFIIRSWFFFWITSQAEHEPCNWSARQVLDCK